MTDQSLQILRDAVARNVAVALLFPGGEQGRGRLLAEDGRSVWVDATPADGAAYRPGVDVGVRFRSGAYLVEFETPAVRFDPAFPLRPGVAVPALQLAWPADVRLTQRRNGYRARPASPTDPALKVWPIVNPASPATAVEVRAELRDLSISGMSMALRAKRTGGASGQLSVAMGDALTVELSTGGAAMALTGRVSQPPRAMPDGSLQVGLHFDAMDHTIEGRRTLAQVAKVVAELQRAEARRRAG